jgi:uncharacterized protein YndB with AHSA1/START domain
MSNLTGSAVVTKSGDKLIVITRHVEAPRALVWEAHHNPDYVSKWWGLPEAANHITEIDLRPGGRWRFGQRQADGSEVIFTGEYLELDPPKRFVYTKGWPKVSDERGEDSVDLEDSVITISFEEIATGTVVTLTCAFSSEALRDKVAESGMNRLQKSYDRMDDLLETLL